MLVLPTIERASDADVRRYITNPTTKKMADLAHDLAAEMLFTPYLEPKLLNAAFGNTALAPAGTLYVGLVLQCATLTTALTAGTAYTSLAFTGGATYAIASGDVLLIGTGTTTQAVVTSGSCAAAGTTVGVTSFIANATYATGTPFIRCTVYAVAQEPTIGTAAYARVSIANNTTTFPNATGSTPASISNGIAVTFPTATASWGTVAGFLISDASSGGNLYCFGMLNAAQAISSGNTPSFAIGALTITEQ